VSYVRIDSLKLAAQTTAIARELARRAANRVALRARASIIGQGRYLTGAMMAGYVITDVTKNPKKPTYRITNRVSYYAYQELGTPRSAPGVGFIYPKKPGGRLVFTPKGATHPVFATRVRGVRPGEFLKRAAAATLLKDFTDPGV
jgi:hypothetical protein